jgi:hypothetical protein
LAEISYPNLPFGFILLAGNCASIFACFWGSTAIGQRETVVCPLLSALLSSNSEPEPNTPDPFDRRNI